MENHLNTLGRTDRPVSPEVAHSFLILQMEMSRVRHDVMEEGTGSRSFNSEPSRRLHRVQRHVAAAIVLLGCLLLCGTAAAQSTFGSIRGVAEDESGAAIPDATVTLHSLDTNADRVVKTNESGEYALENVLAGKYSLQGSHDGFSNTVINDIALTARQESRYILTLKVAAQAQTVEVTSGAAQINTENGIIGDSKGSKDIGQLPLNFRGATTSPLTALQATSSVQEDSQGNMAIGSATANQIGYSVDGVSTANIFESSAQTNTYPSSEGIQELKVTAFNNNAEFAQVADVTFTTRGGTNQYHGNLFEYLQNDALDARVFSFAQKAPKHFNTFGGSIGGPVVVPHLYDGHNKTFFFFDYEGNRRRTSQAEQYTVPTAADRTGNLNDLASTFPLDPTDPTGQRHLSLINPATGQPYSNNTITNINPFATALLNQYYPLPNLNAPAGQVNYQTLVPVPSNTDGFDLRVDQVLTSKQQIYARFNRKNLSVNVVNPLLPNDVDSEHDRSFLISHNYVINTRMVNEFRFGYTDSILAPNFGIVGADALQGLNIQVGGAQGVNVSNHPADQGFPSIFFNDGTNFTPIGRDHVGPTESKTKQITDNFTYNHGRHTIRAGVDVRWVRFAVPEIETPSDDYGLFTFNQSTFTNSSFGDLLLGLPNTTYFAVTGPRDNGTAHQYGFYGEDQWEVNNHLTVNVGLRYEYLPGFQDAIGNMANFDPATNTVIIPDRLANGMGAVPAFLQSFNSCSLPDRNMNLPCSNFETASQAHMPQSLRQNYKYNFDPRIGIAYRPFSDNKTVVRAGFGVFTVSNLGPLAFNMSSNPTASVHTYQNNNNGVPLFQFPQALTTAQSVQYGGGALEQGDAPNYRDPQVIQWNLTVEREITPSTAAHVSYVGMEGHRQNVTIDLNQIPENTQGYNIPSGGWVDPRAPFQNWAQIYQSANLGSTAYHALQAGVTHRLSHV